MTVNITTLPGCLETDSEFGIGSPKIKPRCYLRKLRISLVTLVALSACRLALGQSLLPGFTKAGQGEEQVRWSRLASGVRVFVDAPLHSTASRRLLVIYATPNGNTIEQTLGCATAERIDWRFDIQHVAAQIRRFRELQPELDVVLAVVQAPKLSWPTFRREQPDAGGIIRKLVESLAEEFTADRVALTGHSGGGSFVLGYLDAVESLPASIERIVLLDANYSYSDSERHGDKLLGWLRGDSARRLVVIAYDDREVTLNGKKVVGPDGGTYRASQRMLARFGREVKLIEQSFGVFQHTSGLDGQIQFFIHPNPENKILHTALVGDMNGLLHGLTVGTERGAQWGQFGGARAYTKWVQAEPFLDPTRSRATIPSQAPEVALQLPPRQDGAPTGSEFQQQIAALPRQQREAAIVHEITSGNIPDFMRRLVPVQVAANDETGARHAATYFVTADYLAVGTDADFFRVPMNPHSGAAVAKEAGASLITRKVSDDVFAAAEIKLEPRPLTKDRETVATFHEHHQIIEQQLADKPHGRLVAGIKKDVVLSNRLLEKPHKVAIYGWHYPDGHPIQPLYVGHVDWYVDYSHGIRLLASQVIVDGKPLAVEDVLKDRMLHPLLSNEGPIDISEVQKAADWRP